MAKLDTCSYCPSRYRRFKPGLERYSRLPSGNGAMPCAPDARPPSQKPSTRTAYATVDTVGLRRPMFNTSSPLPAPTLSDSLNTGPTSVDDHEAVCKNSFTHCLTANLQDRQQYPELVPEPVFTRCRQIAAATRAAARNLHTSGTGFVPGRAVPLIEARAVSGMDRIGPMDTSAAAIR